MRIEARLTDAAVLEELGLRVRESRLARNLTQGKVAQEAGVSVPTVNKLEHGKPVQLITLIRVLRVLGEIDGLDAALPRQTPSPIDQLRRRGKERKRASRRRTKDPADPAHPFRWGDERGGW